MSALSGIGGLPRIPLAGPEERPHRIDPAGPGRAAAAPQPAAEAASLREGADDIPAEAPSGVDADLWSILTSEERRFFARTRALGPLTYGPRQGSAPAAGPAPGGRIDVRV